MQPAKRCDTLRARAQHQVISVSKQNIGARFGDLVGQYAFDRRRSADRHECRGPDGSMGRLQNTASGEAILAIDSISQAHAPSPLARLNRQASP